MLVRVKTREQLAATGWSSDSSGHWHYNGENQPAAGDHRFIMLAAMLDDLEGQDVEVPEYLAQLQPNETLRLASGRRWRVCLEMLLVGRLKTREQLLADGYIESSRGAPSTSWVPTLLHPENEYGVTREMAKFLGTNVPIHVSIWTRDEDRQRKACGFMLEGQSWSPHTLVTTSTTGLLFGGFPRRWPAVELKNPKILEFRDAGFDQAKNMISCGFELETQSSDGRTVTPLASDPIDYLQSEKNLQLQIEGERYPLTMALSCWAEEKPYWIAEKILKPGVSYVRTSLENIGIKKIGDLVQFRLMSEDTATKVRARVEAQFRKEWDHTKYRMRPEQVLRVKGNIPASVDVGLDGSVKGFEFRTIGPLSHQQFKDAATAVFSVNHDIDTECSFHIHLAVKDVKHEHGDWIQKGMCEYLIENMNRVPESVKQRWKSVNQNRYIQPGVRRSKYSFLWRHPQGTWEFRGFGNVKNVEDAMICLQLAIEAMQYAYKVATEKEELFSKGFKGSWKQLCIDTLSRAVTISDFLKAPTRTQVTDKWPSFDPFIARPVFISDATNNDWHENIQRWITRDRRDR